MDRMVDRLQPRPETAVEALEIAMRSAREEGRLRHATALADPRDGLLARLTPRDALRAAADVEAAPLAVESVTQVGRPAGRESVGQLGSISGVAESLINK